MWYSRPCIDSIQQVVLLRGHPQSFHTVHCAIDHCGITTRQVLGRGKYIYFRNINPSFTEQGDLSVSTFTEVKHNIASY